MKTTYEIRDANGQLVACHVRTDKPDGKRVAWKQPSGEWGLNGTPLAEMPLYGAELVSDAGLDELIVLVEGEKARNALERVMIPSVGTVTGASGTPGAEALEVLRGRRVCLWPDHDDQGRAHMQRIGTALQGVASEVLWYTWHEAEEKGADAADHPAVKSRSSKAVDQLLTDLEGAPQWQPKKPTAMAKVRRPETFTAADLASAVIPPVRWAVPGIVPEGVTILAAKPKLGKTWLMLGISVAVAADGVALGTKRVEQGEVLFLALEDNKRRLQKRLRKLLQGGESPPDLHIALEWPRIDEDGAQMLEEWLEEHPRARMVVVDCAQDDPAS